MLAVNGKIMRVVLEDLVTIKKKGNKPTRG